VGAVVQSMHRNEALFWRLAENHLRRDDVERSTMMGSQCLRTGGQFYATVHRRSKKLIVKLPADRVRELVDEGIGDEFKPAGRVFREWLQVNDGSEARWRALLEESRVFVTR
jgi:hypothetical protein